MTATAHCIAHGCTWTAEGTPADVDRAAARHTAPGHATATVCTP